ncbi:hypothetical protein L1987_81231 [Smallanthus sonchifolius]|uniref:Uncharacterized protein n=1 Tax=Smallanthus sonchifolius TaxID=185202 RepID=A0ACB8YRH4_9ASTR|nr:hypothetical protein L1987_81231 [Smallanthus sonchifolius]
MGEDGTNYRWLTESSRASAARVACWCDGVRITDDHRKVNWKMYNVSGGVKLFPYKRIIFQFWRPLADGGRLVTLYEVSI